MVWLQMTHRDFDWEGSRFRLVFAATDSREVNHEIGQMAHGHGALVNDITAPEECDFQVPARICRGQLELTASTGGASPAFARLLRQGICIGQYNLQFVFVYTKFFANLHRSCPMIQPQHNQSFF